MLNFKYKPKPFVKWAGGKSSLLAEIERCLPQGFDKRKNVTYVEPFVGGGAVLFWLLRQYRNNIERVVINDINKDLICTYRAVRNTPWKLLEMLAGIQNEYLAGNDEQRKEYYLAKRDAFNTRTKGSDTETAALFIFLNKTCFNGLYRVNSQGKFNVPHGKYKNPLICDSPAILQDSQLLQEVEILCGDFAETLKFAGDNTLFYFDPPYKPLSSTSSFTAYTKENFDDAEQLRLRDFVAKISKAGSDFILSNSDVKAHNPKNDFFDHIYSQFDIKRVEAPRFINSVATGRGKLSELIITNIQNAQVYGTKF
ncbi:MAG: DNA adenine methylase [Alistipes sp.]